MSNAKGIKNKLEKNTQYLEYTKYKWEFLRRNPEYIKAWGKLYNDPNQKHDNRRSFGSDLTDEEVFFCWKWGIMYPFSPEISFGDYVPIIDETLDHGLMFDQLMAEFGEKTISIIDSRSLAGNNKLINSSQRDVAKTGKLKLEIDLNCPKSKLRDTFQLLLEEWIPIYKSTRRGQSAKNKKKRQQKYSFDNFDTYLKVYDLRQGKMSWAKIAKELNLNSVQTARNHFQSACKLIENGISLYVK